MNKILSAIAANLVIASFATVVCAEDATKPVVPAPPIVASQKPAVNSPAKTKADKLRLRNKKAREASGSIKKTVGAPVEAVSSEVTVVPVAPATPSASKNVSRLNERNRKAKENTKALAPKEAVPTAPAVK